MTGDTAEASTPPKRVITLSECKEHTKESDCWLVIHGKVYNVTKFLDEHPGGFDILLSATGRDATEDFEEIGHSNAASEMLTGYYIGEYEGGDAAAASSKSKITTKASGGQEAFSSSLLKSLAPLLFAVFCAIVYALVYGKGSQA